jgi:outer membrane lipoprotein-sorting protein
MELTMKMIAILPCTLLAAALLGCAQQASNAPIAARPAAAAATTNTFGESADQTASNAAKAREAQYGSETPK